MEFLRRKGDRGAGLNARVEIAVDLPAVRRGHRASAGGLARPAARLKSQDPFNRPFPALVDELKNLHAQILEAVIKAGDETPTLEKAEVTMVIKVPGLRIHAHEHRAQVERTVAALAAGT
jgi:hypothetical protein